LGTAPHRSLAPDAAFRFVNIGRDDSPDLFRAAVGDPRFREIAPVPNRTQHALYHVVSARAAP
jgi:hypothetical protein